MVSNSLRIQRERVLLPVLLVLFSLQFFENCGQKCIFVKTYNDLCQVAKLLFP